MHLLASADVQQVATFRLNYAVGMLSPYGFHIVNVLLHAIASLMVVRAVVTMAYTLIQGDEDSQGDFTFPYRRH